MHFLLLIFQDKLPLNPDHNPGQTPDLAFNTAISFLVNCNVQDYSGETGVTYFTQLFVLNVPALYECRFSYCSYDGDLQRHERKECYHTW